jgi:predicted aldo/keto reductase-like oxidoreductase
VQIQLNYLDWTLQQAKEKYEIITSHGIPVWVMEPCRGGKLANFNDKTNAILKKLRPNDSIASWAFRWAKSLSNVGVILSGMTNLEQLQDNVKTFSDESLLSSKDEAALKEVVESLGDFVLCTGCRYCCDGCPEGLDIPYLISLYNELPMPTPRLTFKIKSLKANQLPSNCIACGACAKVCPQNIDIPSVLKKLDEAVSTYLL